MKPTRRFVSPMRRAQAGRLIGAVVSLGLLTTLLSPAALPASAAGVRTGPTPTLSFTAAPTAADPGATFAVDPTVTVTDSTDAITLSLAVDTGEPSGKLTCPSLTVTPVDGVATFPGCSVDKGGRYLLRATLGAVTADSASLLVSGPAYVAFSTQPSGGPAAQAWLGQPVATVVDGDGAVVADSTAKVGLVVKPGTGTGGGAITCSADKNATVTVAGVATFDGCSIDKAGSGYRLYAVDVDDGVFGTSASFDINSGPAAGLRFDTQPGSGIAGGALGVQPRVSVVDAMGNRVASSTDSISLQVTTGTGAVGAAITCTTNPLAAVAGSATFAGCAVDLASGGYTVTASSGTLTSAVSTPFDVTTGTGSHLAFLTNPGGGPAGMPFATQPVVAVTDAGGNGVGGLVTLSIKPGTGAPGATLTCAATTVAASAGAASFTGCAIDRVSPTPYVLQATLGSVTADSSGFDVTTGGPDSVAFRTEPGDGAGGTPLVTQPTLSVRDAGGNAAAGAVTLALAAGFGTPGATLTCAGGTTTSSVEGIATFSGCRVDKAGAGYRLRATIEGSVAADTSASFDVKVGSATHLAFTAAPGATGNTGGVPWSVQPAVAVQDAGGNLVAASTATIDLSVAGGPGAVHCTADPQAAVRGMAFFNGCSIDRAGTAYRLTASAPGLEPATTAPFDIAVGAPANLVFTTQPSAGVTGQALRGQPVVAVVDAGGNPVPAAGGTVHVTVTPGTGSLGATLSCGGSAVDGRGIASFSGCAVSGAGAGYALTATWGPFSAESMPFVVLRDSAPTLEVAPLAAPLGQVIGDGSLAPNPTSTVNDVNTATGALHHVFTDLQVAGVGKDLVIERTYNSNDTSVGAFGRGVSSILDLSVTFNAAGREATVRGLDGQRIVFTGHQGSFTPPPGARADLTCTGNQKTCTVTQWDGTTWTVTGPRLDSYTDGNGVGLTFVSPSPTQRIVKLATTDAKVTYDVTVTLNASGQVTSVRTPAGRQVSYGYTNGSLTSFTDARGKTWTYAVDAGQRLTGMVDPTGQTRLAATYDATGRVATVSAKGSTRHTEDRFRYDSATQTTTREAHVNVGGSLTWVPYVDTYRGNVLVRQSFPTGEVMRYSYDARGNLTAIQDPNGFVQERVFSSAGDLVIQRTPITSTQTAVVQFGYDRAHRMVSKTDANGNVTAFGYRGADLISIQPPGNKNGATTFSYARSVMVEERTPVGRKTFVPDAQGNIVRITEFGPSGPALNGNGTRAAYTESGLQTSYTDPRGVSAAGALDPAYTATWTYDGADTLLGTRSPVGVTMSLSYTDAGDLVGSSGPAGTTSYGWSESTLTRTTTAPGGVVTRELYDPSATLLAVTGASGGRTTYVNDALGRPVTTIDPSGRRSVTAYDALSNPVVVDDGSGSPIRQEFDSANRLIRQVSGADVTLLRYDLAGNLLRVQDAHGAVTERTYDTHGNVTTVSDGAGTTTYRYDLADQPVSRTDGRGGVTTFGYDGQSRLTDQTVAGNTTTYAYDLAGQRVATVDPEGRRTALTLDGANRTTRTTYSQTGQPSIVVEQTFDARNRRTSMTSGGVVSTYSYDARGNLTGAGPANQRFSYDYSRPGKVLETYPDGTHVTFEVDDAGALMRLDGTSADGHVQASYLRDSNRRAMAISMANGVVESRSYDSTGKVLAQSVQRAGTVLAGETYTYDSAGNRLSQRTTAAGRSVLNAYAYDALGRVSGFSSSSSTVPDAVVATDTGAATTTPPATSGPPSALPAVPAPSSFAPVVKQPQGTPTEPASPPGVSVGYDAVGNILQLGDTRYAVSDGDRITGQTSPNGGWSYDRSGAVTRMTGPNGTTTFGYDAAGRVVRATLQPASGPATTVSYSYDGDGNRISRTVGGATTDYVWDPNAKDAQLVLERSGSTVQRRYFNDETGPVVIQTPTDTYYVHRDPLGSTNQLTDAKGAVVAAYSYDAFGQVSAVGPAAAASDLLFHAQQRDPVTGLYNLRARTYDPASGRFTQREPMATPVGAPVVGAYAFVLNRPTAYVDPSGLMPQLTPSQATSGARLADRADTGVSAIKGAFTAVAKIVVRYGAYGKSLSASAASPAARAAVEAKDAKIAGFGLGLAIVGLSLQAYIAVENCQNGTIYQCVGSSVALAVNATFTALCTEATGGIGAVGCALTGMILSVGLETIINLYGPEIADAFVSFGGMVSDAAQVVGAAISSAFEDAGGAIVSGFNAAGDAIASGYRAFVDTMSHFDQRALQFAATLVSTFDLAYSETAATLLGLGYDIQGVAEAFAQVFQLSVEQAVTVLRDTFQAAATEVASALESAYAATASVVAGALRDAGYAIDEIVTGIHHAYAVTVAGFVTLLADLEYGYNQIASALSDALDVGAEALATVFKALDYTVTQIADALSQIYDAADAAAATVLKAVGFAVSEVAAALQSVYRDAVAVAARVLQTVGYLANEIATGLRDAYQAAAAQVAQILKSLAIAAVQVASALAGVYAAAAAEVAALLSAAGYVVDEVARALSDVFHETVAGVATLLRNVGYAIGEITRVLDAVFAQSVAAIAGILGQIGYAVDQIGAALQSVLNVAAGVLSGVLKDLGYTIDQIGGVLESVYNLAAAAAASVLRDIGYGVAQIGAVLQSVFQEAAAGAAAILKTIGATVNQIAAVLQTTFGQAVEAVGSLLASIGFTSDVIASIGGAFTSFGNDVVDFFKGLF